MTPNKPVVLGLDEDRVRQISLAQLFNEQGVFYRFITDRRKLAAGLSQLNPDLLLVCGELDSDFDIQVLDTLASDVAHSSLPVVVLCNDTNDARFVAGLRTGVVGILPLPFGAADVATIKAIWTELPTRTATANGTADGPGMLRLIDTIRRTRRSGMLHTDPRSASEGRAFFSRGRLERASFRGLVSREALKAIASQPQVRWTFSEVTGQGGEGAGVVIEFGDVRTGEVEVLVPEELPAGEPAAYEVPMRPASQPPEPAPAVVAGAQAPIRLLLVDDDATLLRMFSTLFGKRGFEVTTATDGEQGMELALQHEFDVVLADLNMPRLDGWGLLRLLRDDFRTRELPVAFISAHDDYRESLKALDAGAQAYLSKGTKLDAIVAQVKKLMDPRIQGLAQLAKRERVHLSFAQLGPQWFLKQLAAQKLTGSIEVKDGWASYTLVVQDGALVHALALAGKFSAEGERALKAFLASRSAEGTWTPGHLALPGQSLSMPTEVLLELATSALNENEQRMRDGLMVSATQIDVNPSLYAVYRQVGPKQWLEAARLICEEKLPPRDVIARIDLSPIDVEETMKDLIRRGVVQLRKV